MRRIRLPQVSAQSLVRVGAVAALLYALLALAYVSSCPDVRLRCLLDDSHDQPGLLISATPGLEDDFLSVPKPGDSLTSLAGRPVANFLQFAQAMVRPRWHKKLDPGASLSEHHDPLELPQDSSLWQIEWRDARRVRATYMYQEGGVSRSVVTWLTLQSLPAGRMALTLAWLAVEVGLFLFAAIVHWRRPNDECARVFLALCSVTLVALVGGSYWWIVATSPLLAVPFLAASCALPAMLVHFFLKFPRPAWWVSAGGRWLLALVYAPAAAGASVLIGLSAVAWCLTPGEPVVGPWAELIEAGRGETVDWVMSALRSSMYVYAVVAVSYVLVGLLVVLSAYRRAAIESERRQLRWMLWAGVAACLPIGYVLWLAIVDQSRLALGEAQLALYGTSFLFASAYTVGLLRSRPTLLDEAAEQGFRYALLSSGTTLLFSVAVALASIAAVSPNLPWFGSTLLTMVTLTVAVLLAWWLRERVQRAIDRRFYRERFRLDRAVQGIYRAADESLEPDILGEKTLQSCRDALNVRQAAMYVRSGDAFAITVRDLDWPGPKEIQPTEKALERLGEGTLLQRAPGIQNDVQAMLRGAGAEAIQPVVGRNGVVGLIFLGRRADGQGFSAEDATFLAALGPMTGVALESARIHKNVSQLNDELRSRIELIERQQREIRLLESELSDYRGQETPRSLRADGGSTAGVRSGQTLVRGSSLVIREVLATARKVAASDASVMIRGESGTGKELLARTIHEASNRASGPMVTLHCAALSSSLLESELFGHVKGAFTDARSDRVGRFEQANGGTLFLDEVGDIPLDVQVKLLRVLQERVVERVGSTESRPVDVRLVAATHQNLEELIRSGRFREDLLYRLNVVELRIPPLRERGDDIVELAQEFLVTASANGDHTAERFSADALATLRAFAWPGNVRQLQNVVSRAVVLAEGAVVEATDLPVELQMSPAAARRNVALPGSGGDRRDSRVFASPSGNSPAMAPASVNVVSAIADPLQAEREASELQERAVLTAALRANGGNKAAAARALRMPRSTFYSKLKKLGIE